MMRCCSFSGLIAAWIRDYEWLQSSAVIILYVQIACALVGSLGAQYNGVLLTNLTIALFALVAIESNSQKLARIYAALLFCAISLDIAWFILFTRDIWSFSSKAHGEIFIFSVKLTLAMQIVGCTVRIASSFIWIQFYRLGVSYISIVASPEADFDLRNSFLSPVIHSITRQSSDSDAVLGEAIYDPHHFSSLFEGSPNARSLDGCNHSFPIGDGSQQNSSVLRLSEVDVERIGNKLIDNDDDDGVSQSEDVLLLEQPTS